MPDELDPFQIRLSRRAFLAFPLIALPPLAVPDLVRPRIASGPLTPSGRPYRVTHRGPTPSGGLAEAIVIKDGELFFLADAAGSVPFQEGHAFGLYFHDCRYLNGYEMRLAGTPLVALAATGGRGFMAKFELANLKMKMPNGGVIQREEIEVQWHRIIDSEAQALDELLTIQNFAHQPVECPFSMSFRAEFEDIYAVREFLSLKFGTLRTPQWKNGALFFWYDGRDGVHRRLSVHFSPTPDRVEGTAAHFDVKLAPREVKQLRVSLII